MSRFRKVYLQMYGDEKYRRLTPPPPCGQVLWWHLIAGKQTGVVPGLFSIGEAAFAELLKWPLEGFREAFAEVFREGLVEADWEAPLIWVPNAIKYNTPQSPNVVLSWKNSWKELPQCELKVKAAQRLKAFLEGFGETFSKAFAEASGEAFEKLLARGRAQRQETRDKRKEKENTPPSPPKGGVGVAATPTPEEFKAAWNAISGFVSIRVMSPKRIQKLSARCRERDWVEHWREALERVSRSSFCLGQGNCTWVANVDWFLQGETLNKILEGTYDDRHRNGSTSNGHGKPAFQERLSNLFAQRGIS